MGLIVIGIAVILCCALLLLQLAEAEFAEEP
jgi:hypothetical protein